MGLQRNQQQLLPFLMIWISYSCLCYSSYDHDNSLFQSLEYDQSSVVYDHNSAYPTYYGADIDGGGNVEFDPDFDPNFSSWFSYEAGSSYPERVGQVGSPSPSVNVFDVADYRAKDDGSDDTEAFKKAWKEACSSGGAVLLVPQNKKYFLKPIHFLGPCKSDITMKVYGTIEASGNRSDYEQDTRHWLLFNNVHNLIIEGGGTFDGNGDIWWQNSCKRNKSQPCIVAPTALTFYKCTNLRVRNLKIKDAQQIHVSIEQSTNVQAQNLMITAPERSPNTDGIHIAGTKNIQIMSSVIKTGDDCISIVDGAHNIHAMYITCGPGHGISIGSLGANKSEQYVSDVVVDTARFIGTTNGVRIKTWQGGSGSASKIIFQNISMKNVTNPIIVDQHYCDQVEPCKEQDMAVKVQDVVYKNIKGTSASKVAIKFDCSERYPCQGILLQDIDLVSSKGGHQKAQAQCKNVHITEKGNVSPYCP